MGRLVMDKVYRLCPDILEKKCAGIDCPHGRFHNYNPELRCGYSCENPFPLPSCPACICITPNDAKIIMEYGMKK